MTETTPEEDQSLVLQHTSNTTINVGGQTVTRVTEALPERQRSLIRWLFTVTRENSWSWPKFEEQTGMSRSTGSKVFNGRYVDKDGKPIELDAVCDRIAEFRRKYEARLEVETAGEIFFNTSVWHRVDFLCKQVFKRKKVGFLYGESQIGKSTCLKHYQKNNNHGQTAVVEMPPSSGVQLMLRMIARGLHVPDKTPFESLLEDVKTALDPSKLLIIDEFQRIFTTYQKTSVMRCAEVIRHIHDQTKCGIVLCGTNTFRTQLKESEFMQYLKQFVNRAPYIVRLPDTPPRADLDLIARQFHLPPAPKGSLEEKVLVHLAKHEGFGTPITRLQDASEMAEKRGEKLAWSHFVKAHNICLKMAQEAEWTEEAA